MSCFGSSPSVSSRGWSPPPPRWIPRTFPSGEAGGYAPVLLRRMETASLGGRRWYIVGKTPFGCLGGDRTPISLPPPCIARLVAPSPRLSGVKEEVKTRGFGQTWVFLALPPASPWAGHSAAPSLSSLVCKIGIVSALASRGCRGY